MFPEEEQRETLRNSLNFHVMAVVSQHSQFKGSRGTLCNSAVLRCEVKDFAMMPTQRFWRETVSLLDVM